MEEKHNFYFFKSLKSCLGWSLNWSERLYYFFTLLLILKTSSVSAGVRWLATEPADGPIQPSQTEISQRRPAAGAPEWKLRGTRWDEIAFIGPIAGKFKLSDVFRCLVAAQWSQRAQAQVCFSLQLHLSNVNTLFATSLIVHFDHRAVLCKCQLGGTTDLFLLFFFGLIPLVSALNQRWTYI